MKGTTRLDTRPMLLMPRSRMARDSRVMMPPTSQVGTP